jgi:hypothetical protein
MSSFFARAFAPVIRSCAYYSATGACFGSNKVEISAAEVKSKTGAELRRKKKAAEYSNL